MYKIEFSGLSFDSSDYKNIKFNRGLPLQIQNHEIKISDTWNGETFDVQTTFYDQYKLEFFMRATQLSDFEKIKYAPVVNIYYNLETNPIGQKNISAKITNFEVQDYVLEFKKVILNIIDLSTEITETVLETINNENTLSIVSSGGSVLKTVNLYKNYYIDHDFVQNEYGNFKNKIVDYNKLTLTYKVRIYLSRINFNTFISYLSTVSPTKSYIRIGNESIQYRYFDFAKDRIAKDFYKVDLTLHFSNNIITNY